MKGLFRIFTLAMAMAAFCTGALAQKSDRQRMTREQLAEAQAKYIAKELAMDDATTKQFAETFCQFQKDLWALGPRPKKGADDTDEAAEQSIKARFAHRKKILGLREKYYEEYSKFLTQKQIGRVYELERQIMERLSKRKNGSNQNRE